MRPSQTQGGRSDAAGSRSSRIRTAHRARGDRGAALVEFALVLPLLAMLLLGTITGGFALNQKQQITSATREGARYAATVAPDQVFVSGTWAQNVQALIVERSAGDLVTGDVCVSLVQGSPGTVVTPTATYSTSGAPCIANQTYPTTANDTGLRIQVTGSRTGARSPRIELGAFGGFPVNIVAQATVKSEEKL